MRGLDDMVRAGKVLYIGISDTPAWVVAQANTLADLRGWSRFVGLQVKYSLLERTIERELLPMAHSLDLGVTPWGVLGSGVLSGKYNKDSAAEGRAAMGNAVKQRDLDIAQHVLDIAAEIGCSASQVALAWVRRQKGVMIPLIGARSIEQLDDNLGCLDIQLSEEQVRRLDEASAIELGFPHDFLAGDYVRSLVYGGTYDKVDNHRA